MVRLVWRTDIHMSDQTPCSRKDVWHETVLDKISQVGVIANEVKATAVIDGGDFFDQKSPQKTSHNLIRMVAEAHRSYSCPVYANIGNHDCVYGDYSYIDQQPLGVLFSTGVFHRLYDEHEAVFTANGVTVRVVGIPYHNTKEKPGYVSYDWDRFASIKKGDEDYLVVTGHVLASQKGGAMFDSEDIIKYADLAGLDPDMWLFGHWHKDQGITEIADGKWVVNIGSLTRGSLIQDDLDRKPACVVLGFTESGIEIDRRDLQVRSGDDAFDIETKLRVTANEEEMVESLRVIDDTINQAGTKSIRDLISEMEIDPEVREKAILIWEGVV